MTDAITMQLAAARYFRPRWLLPSPPIELIVAIACTDRDRPARFITLPLKVILKSSILFEKRAEGLACRALASQRACWHRKPEHAWTGAIPHHGF
jgi:hypothetical protein